jgi:hypothetical protein
MQFPAWLNSFMRAQVRKQARCLSAESGARTPCVALATHIKALVAPESMSLSVYNHNNEGHYSNKGVLVCTAQIPGSERQQLITEYVLG